MEKKAGFILLLITRAATASADHEIICSSKPVKAAVSKDVTLQCHLVPPLDATNMTVKWRHESQDRTLRLNQDGHTSLFPEELTKGNLSLKISSVQLSDSGRYRCSVTRENLQHSCYVDLTVGPTKYMVLIITIIVVVVLVTGIIIVVAVYDWRRNGTTCNEDGGAAARACCAELCLDLVRRCFMCCCGLFAMICDNT